MVCPRIYSAENDFEYNDPIFRLLFDSIDSERQAQARSIYKHDVAEFVGVVARELSEIRQILLSGLKSNDKNYLHYLYRLSQRERELTDDHTCKLKCYVDYIDSPKVEARRSEFLSVPATSACQYDINGWPANTPALKLANIRSRATLIICPVSLVGQWAAEVSEKVAGNKLTVHKYYDRNRKRSAKDLSIFDIVITTYETLGKDMRTYSPMMFETTRPPLLQINWHRIIFDESHLRLTKDTLVTRAARALCSKRRWMVTGTPFQGHVKNISMQCSCIGLYALDTDRFWEKMMAQDFRIVACNALLRRIMIRHSNAMSYQATGSTLTELPGKVEEQVDIRLSAIEMQEYNLLQEKLQLSYLRKQEKWTEKNKLFNKLIKELQRACSGIISSSTSCDNNDDVVDDDNHDNNIEVKRLISDRGLSADVLNILPCAKLTWLMDKLQYIRDNCPDAKVLIFSQFTSTFQRIIGPLIQSGYQFRTLTNNMKEAARTKALSDFRNDPPTTIFLLCMRAGSVGLNLTEANHVILMDPCLNKQVEYQAVGRVHRIGQRREVKIYRLACLGTVEERIVHMHSLGEVVSEESTAGSLRVDRVKLPDEQYRSLLGLPPAEGTVNDAQEVQASNTTTPDQDVIMKSPDSDNPMAEEDDGVNLQDQSNNQSMMSNKPVDREASFNACLIDEAQHLHTFETPTLSSSMPQSESFQIDEECSPLFSDSLSPAVYLPIIGKKRLRKRQPIGTIHQRGRKETLRFPIDGKAPASDLRDSDEELWLGSESDDDVIPKYWHSSPEKLSESEYEPWVPPQEEEEVQYDLEVEAQTPIIPPSLNISSLKQTLRTLSEQLQLYMADPNLLAREVGATSSLLSASQKMEAVLLASFDGERGGV